MEPEAIAAFAGVLLATYWVAWRGRRASDPQAELNISKQRLNRWLVGLSAGAAANSGFVVTGAVGLGYTYGVYWLLLPFGWFLGDLVFWKYFPHRLNAYGAKTSASTLAALVTHGLQIGRLHPLAVASSVLVVLCLGGYTMAQWVAGQKFLAGAFGVSGTWPLLLFAVVILGYTILGKFRGSVYADTLQACTRLLGTVLAVGTVTWWALRDTAAFQANLLNAGDAFLSLLGNGTLVAAAGCVVGYAAASLGFGLGQPHVTSRYLAALSPEEARAARWIYIGYVQSTWATMTVFGVLLRGVMPDIADPEQGLTVFVRTALPPVLVGLVAADIFGEIASTANSLLIAMAQAARELPVSARGRRIPLGLWSLFLGVVTLVATLVLAQHASVFGLAITSVSLMAAGLAPAVAIKVLEWPHTAKSLTAAVLVGLSSALVWQVTGLSSLLNESAIGIVMGFLAHYVLRPRRHAAKNASVVRLESVKATVPPAGVNVVVARAKGRARVHAEAKPR